MQKRPKTTEEFVQISHKISTRDIRSRLEALEECAGNYDPKKDPMIKTQSIKPILEGMAFTVKSGGGTNNKTFVIDSPRYKDVLETNLHKFGSEITVKCYEDPTNEELINLILRGEPASKKKNPGVKELGGAYGSRAHKLTLS